MKIKFPSLFFKSKNYFFNSIMDQTQILSATKSFVQEALKNAESGHDWWHIQRVLANALTIGKTIEEADIFVVQLVALLHDIDDWKFIDEKEKTKKSVVFLKSVGLPEETVNKIDAIIDKISFKGAGDLDKMEEIEGKIVQDADRLDALGAIGVARCFSYGGFRNREMYNPEKKPYLHANFEEYKKNTDGTSLNHFYEKLFLLKDRMKTQKGKEMAIERHLFMEEYVKRFLAEWNGEL